MILSRRMIGRIVTPIPGPRSKDLARRLQKVESPGVTYLTDDFPVFWEKALGSNVEDVDGNLYVDLTSAFGVSLLGHAHPAIAEAVRKQLALLPHGMGDVHPPEIKVQLLERLAQLSPIPNAQILLSNGGAEAVEAALKSAHLATGKPGVITFEGAYHGLTYGTLSVSGQSRFSEPFFSQLGHFGRVASFPKEVETSIRELTDLIHTSKHQIGAILIEPIQGRAGVRVPPKDWLRQVRNLCDQKGVLLILDEIMTGMGRTGTWFACQAEDVTPDLLCIGKALTGMMPLSACIGSADVMKYWPSLGGEALHTSTFLGHPLGCAAALASIDEIEKGNFVERVNQMGRAWLEELKTWEKTLPIVLNVRGRGMMIGIELHSNTTPAPAAVAAQRALAKGLILLPSGAGGNVISLTPPITITETELKWATHTLYDVLRTFN